MTDKERKEYIIVLRDRIYQLRKENNMLRHTIHQLRSKYQPEYDVDDDD